VGSKAGLDLSSTEATGAGGAEEEVGIGSEVDAEAGVEVGMGEGVGTMVGSDLVCLDSGLGGGGGEGLGV